MAVMIHQIRPLFLGGNFKKGQNESGGINKGKKVKR